MQLKAARITLSKMQSIFINDLIKDIFIIIITKDLGATRNFA